MVYNYKTNITEEYLNTKFFKKKFLFIFHVLRWLILHH